jgi:dsDNA-binding SOS-regulon protein
MIKLEALVDAIHNSVMKANDVLLAKNDDLIKTYFKKDKSGNFNKAKTITLQFPQANESGKIKMLDVEVPLITLVPIATSQIEEMKFETDLNLHLVGEKNELQVSFGSEPSTSKNKTNSDSRSTPLVGHIEITIKPGETSEGLKRLIEGYEKLLRAQIPG